MENNKINIAELLKDCPQGTKLYSPIFGDVYLDKIRPHLGIVVTTDKEQGDFKEEFLYDGRYGMNGECMLFPSKDKTTWEGFIPPCTYKDGDVIYFMNKNGDEFIVIFEKFDKYVKLVSYINFSFYNSNLFLEFPLSTKVSFWIDSIKEHRLATEEEKQKLFDAIRENGYKWNAETKTLEKLVAPKFKVGDRIKKNKDRISYTIIGFNDDGFYKTEYQGGRISYVNFEHQDEWELVPDEIEPKFKVGDEVVTKGPGLKVPMLITNIVGEFYYYDKYGNGDIIEFFTIKEQDNYVLVSDKIEPKFKVGDVV